MLGGKKIILGVTGSIAAYKAACLVRLLVKEGAEVQVIMTRYAKEFITPLTLATLSKRPILTEFFNPENGNWNNHVDLGQWADAFVVAPASANTIAKMANGIADNLLLTTYLSVRCPVFVAPAMDLDMYQHPATTENIRVIMERGAHIIEPATGELASGLSGKGRMEEPETICDVLNTFFLPGPDNINMGNLAGKRALVTAGPTREAIDPVRFISNHSSGLMGYAIANTLARYGAKVTLISGPTSIGNPHPAIELVRVESAADMFAACKNHFTNTDITIFSAAVADYRPDNPSRSKLKRKEAEMTLKLSANPDIAAELGTLKKEGQVTIGFALETENELENARKKLIQKNLDAIILNSLSDPGAGFNTETNKITIIGKDNKCTNFELKSKKEAAWDIVAHIAKIID